MPTTWNPPRGSYPTVQFAAAALAAAVGLLAPATARAQHHRTPHGNSHASHATHATHGRHARVDLGAYRSAVRGWHDPSRVAPAQYTPDGRLVLRLWSVNTHAECAIVPPAAGQPFDDAARTDFSRVLGDPRTHLTTEIDPQLMALAYNVADHFHAPQLTVISGYRANSGHSNHARGRAMDFLIPGVADRDVAEYARTLGAVGVGIYPVSGFVHLDVRDTFYTWVDSSGPGSGHHHHRHHHGHHARTARR